MLASDAVSRLQARHVSLASAISACSRARSRRELLDAGLELALPLGGALASRSRFSCSILKRARTAPLAASWSRKGCSCSAASASALIALASASVARPDLLQRARQAAPPRCRPGPAPPAQLQIEDDGVELADLGRHLLVAPRLPGLPLQALDLRAELAQDVVEAGEVALGRAAAAAPPRGGGCAGRRCRRHPRECGGAARAWR